MGVKNENETLTNRKFKIPGTEGYTFYHTVLSEISLADSSENFKNENRKVGDKMYELSNHLGNVLEVITDRKIPVDAGGGVASHYTADVVSYCDYGPFGMTLSGRSGNTSEMRHTFQGQEQDPEIKGNGNSINYKYRMHDPRIGRFFAVDPLAREFPYNSPYAFSENRVIDGIELEGLEVKKLSNGQYVYYPNCGNTVAKTFPLSKNFTVDSEHTLITEDADRYGTTNGLVFLANSIYDDYGVSSSPEIPDKVHSRTFTTTTSHTETVQANGKTYMKTTKTMDITYVDYGEDGIINSITSVVFADQIYQEVVSASPTHYEVKVGGDFFVTTGPPKVINHVPDITDKSITFDSFIGGIVGTENVALIKEDLLTNSEHDEKQTEALNQAFTNAIEGGSPPPTTFSDEDVYPPNVLRKVFKQWKE